MTSPCCNVCLKKDVEFFANPDMDSLLYCEPCLAQYNLQRFYRPNFIPDARVSVEYHYIPEYDKKKKCWTTEAMKPLDLPKTQGFQNQNPPSILELARLPHEHMQATSLAEKHPHPKDKWVRLDETGKKHDYYVMINGKEESQYFQSTSGVIHEVFPKHVPDPVMLLFGENKHMFDSDIWRDYYTESKQNELKQFATRVLEPLKQMSRHKYEQYAFLDKILGSAKWGPDHPKHGKYYHKDKDQLVSNLQKMHIDWDQKANDGQTRGTFVHYLIELDMNGQLDLASHLVYGQPHLNHIQQYLNWKRDKFDPFFEPYRTEMRLCDCNEQMQSTYRRVGTCDLIAVPKNHPPPSETNSILRVKLIDWKNTIIETHSFFEKGKGYRMGNYPMDNVEDCNLRHYELQQADYQYMLQKFYKDFVYNGHIYSTIEFIGRELVCFDDSNPNNEAVVIQLNNPYIIELDIIWQRRRRDVELWLETQSKAQQQQQQQQQQQRRFTNEESRYLLMHLIRKNELIVQTRSVRCNGGPETFQEHKRRRMGNK